MTLHAFWLSLHYKSSFNEVISKGIHLVYTAINGNEGGMDPKGGCDDCTNVEIKAAVEYIVSQTQ